MADLENMSPAAQAAAKRYARKMQQAKNNRVSADFRAESEDDDGYDPYSDYMDAQSRSMVEELEEDPWR